MLSDFQTGPLLQPQLFHICEPRLTLGEGNPNTRQLCRIQTENTRMPRRRCSSNNSHTRKCAMFGAANELIYVEQMKNLKKNTEIRRRWTASRGKAQPQLTTNCVQGQRAVYFPCTLTLGSFFWAHVPNGSNIQRPTQENAARTHPTDKPATGDPCSRV